MFALDIKFVKMWTINEAKFSVTRIGFEIHG